MKKCRSLFVFRDDGEESAATGQFHVAGCGDWMRGLQETKEKKCAPFSVF